MSTWLVRAGSRGEWEEIALSKELAIMGWNEIPDLAQFQTKESLRRALEQQYPSATVSKISNFLGQLWAFGHRIQDNDVVVLPLKTTGSVALGIVEGPYRYRTDLGPNIRHTRRVIWKRQDVPRTAFDQDVLYSFGAFMTVCEIKRNGADQRVRAVLEGKPATPVSPSDTDTDSDALVGQHPDVEALADDQLLQFINRKFKGHYLADLIDAVLQAEGYSTHKSRPGPDGGVDILAAGGNLGFNSPKIAAQVKSEDRPIDIESYRAFQGSMTNFGAEYGLFVAWGGFQRSVLSEAKRQFFNVRLWSSKEVIAAIKANYERLPESIQAELPMKRIWSLVLDETEGESAQ